MYFLTGRVGILEDFLDNDSCLAAGGHLLPRDDSWTAAFSLEHCHHEGGPAEPNKAINIDNEGSSRILQTFL